MPADVPAKRAERPHPSSRPEREFDVPRLLHELEVHQVELESQNEELRNARLELEAGLARYTELFDFAPIGYARLDAHEAICELNHVGAQLLGSERGRLVGRSFRAFISAADRARFSQLLARAAVDEVKQVEEFELEVSGAEFPMPVRITAAPGRSERTTLLAFEDISERRTKEVQLDRTQQALREADRRKDEFLAVLSHELRNPLGPIWNSIFVLRRMKPSLDDANKLFGVIDRQISHLTRLIDDLLDVTRIRRGKITLQRERLELGELVRRTLDDQRAGFRAREIELEGRFAAELLWVSADPARLVQVLTNLLGNAEKFTPPGGKVFVSLARQDMNAVMRVTDTGAGISSNVLGYIFEPFAQAPQTMDRARGGLGLGLSMVKGLVELHGGTVTIVSEGAERGTEVTVSLPLAESPAPAIRRDRPPPPARVRRVVVIEDNVDAADTLHDALTFIGHEVQVAYDGPTGVEQAKQFLPDVVLCDIGLPGMDGYAVARALRAHEPLKRAFLIALTGYARPEDLQRALEAGFDQHVAKPPSLEKLSWLLAEAPLAELADPPGSPESAS